MAHFRSIDLSMRSRIVSLDLMPNVETVQAMRKVEDVIKKKRLQLESILHGITFEIPHKSERNS